MKRKLIKKWRKPRPITLTLEENLDRSWDMIDEIYDVLCIEYDGGPEQLADALERILVYVSSDS